jgi:hypothetical protein
MNICPRQELALARLITEQNLDVGLPGVSLSLNAPDREALKSTLITRCVDVLAR